MSGKEKFEEVQTSEESLAGSQVSEEETSSEYSDEEASSEDITKSLEALEKDADKPIEEYLREQNLTDEQIEDLKRLAQQRN